MNKNKWLITAALWLIMIFAAVYLLSWRYLKTFDHNGLYPQQVVDEAPIIELLQQFEFKLGAKKQIVIFHWLDPSCQCTTIGRLFVERLVKQTSSATVSHLILTPTNTDQSLIDTFGLSGQAKVIVLSPQQYELSRQLIPATPSAIVYYAKTRSISYLGPHSSGVTCGTGTNYIELVLNNLSHGFDPKLIELQQSGCFCSW